MTEDLDVGAPEEFSHNGLRAVNTCWACPERYDVFCGEEYVGYLRLRHGHFTADAFRHGDHAAGEQVLHSRPMGDGQFLDEERATYLTKALEAIDKWLKEKL